MSASDQDSRRRADRTRRQGQIPLFRTGHPLIPQPVLLDQRTGREIFANPPTTPVMTPARIWESINEITVDGAALAGNGLFLSEEQSPAARTFDILRTRILKGMARHGWTRLAISSPTHGCGKSFVAGNLALSLARLPSCRTVLLDLELRGPALARLFGHEEPSPLLEVLMGEQPLESHFRRIGRNLALGLNDEAVPQSAETFQDPEFAASMRAIRDLLQPDIVLLDIAPALGSDDLIALAGQIDAVLLVCDGTRSSPTEIARTERLLEEAQIPLMGVVLNRAQDRDAERYAYGNR